MIHTLPGAQLDDRQKRVIFAVQEHTIAAGVDLTVTRGHSSPAGQLATIEKAAREQGCIFTEFIPGNVHDKVLIWRGSNQEQLYNWQQTWSMLLHKGVIINPPLAAVCLEHYINAAGVDMKDKIIYPSPHIKLMDDPMPCPIDFSGRVNRGTNAERIDLPLIVDILRAAKNEGAGIRFIKPEPKNVCVHVDLDRDA